MGKYLIFLILLISSCAPVKNGSLSKPLPKSTFLKKENFNIPDTVKITEIFDEDILRSPINSRVELDQIRRLESNSVSENISTTNSRDILGQIVYKIPDTMVIHRDHKIVVRISKESNLISIQDNLSGKVVVSQVRVENRMEVKIIDPTGENFKIIPINRERQLIESGEYTQWNFNVVPIKTGKDLKLDLVVSIVIGEDTREIVYTDKILVKSNPKKQVKSWWERNWHWFFEIMLIPFAIWMWNSIRKKIKENS